jgi:hypothetical protein
MLRVWSYTSGIFDDSFIDHLFDLVEQTRGMQDETFNYSVIKLIVSVVFFTPSRYSNLVDPPGRTQRAVHGRLGGWQAQYPTSTRSRPTQGNRIVKSSTRRSCEEVGC